MEIPDLLSDGGFRLNALIMVRLFAKDLRATGNGFRNAPVPAIPSDSERGMVALRKHCETALRPGPVYEKVNMYVLHKMTARRFVGSQAESVGLFRS